MSDPGIVTVRPFEVEQDLEKAADLGDRVRAEDSCVEPFAQRLALLATGPRALLQLWQVASGEDGRLHGLSFAALRELRGPQDPASPPGVCAAPGASAGKALARTTVELYALVRPALRRQGLGRALIEPSLRWLSESPVPAALRTRVRDLPEAQAGQEFLKSLGFTQTSAQLQLGWSPSRRLDESATPGIVVTPLQRSDPRAVAAFANLQNDAWAGAPDAFATRADELAQLLLELGRVVLIAQVEGKPVGYLSGVFLGRTLGIEEVAVLPALRRMGIGRALIVHALVKDTPRSAILSVSEDNRAARALYKSLGFSQTARRFVLQRLGGPGAIGPAP